MPEDKNLALEKRTELFAKNIIHICRQLPFNSVNKVLVDQLMRAATSVGANYIEANESLSKPDFVYRIKICRKEAREAEYWIRLVYSANHLIEKEARQSEQESRELFLIFCSILKKVE